MMTDSDSDSVRNSRFQQLFARQIRCLLSTRHFFCFRWLGYMQAALRSSLHSGLTRDDLTVCCSRFRVRVVRCHAFDALNAAVPCGPLNRTVPNVIGVYIIERSVPSHRFTMLAKMTLEDN